MRITRRALFGIVAVALFSSALYVMANVIDLVLLTNKLADDNRITLIGKDYVYGQTPPQDMGDISDPDKAYIHVSLRFRLDSTEGYPNIFQTGPMNKGLRLEFFDNGASVYLPDDAAQNHISNVNFSEKIEKGVWYSLDVDALNHGFVRVFLNGRRVAYYPSAHVDLDVSKILVGSGFNGRDFRGAIDHVRLTKGNLKYLSTGYGQIYAAAALLFLLSFVCLSKFLDKHIFVRKIFWRLAMLSIPVMAIVFYFESCLGGVNTYYYLKRLGLERQIDDVECLILGSSTAIYGIDPSVFPVKTYNLSLLGNETYIDSKLVQRYVPRMKNLKYVVITVTYFTMNMTYSNFPESWRQYFLQQFFNVSSSTQSGLWGRWSYWIEPRNFSRIALYGNQAKDFAGSMHAIPVDIIIDKNGWYDSGTGYDEAAKALSDGRATAEWENSTFNVDNVKRNIAYLENTIQYLKNRDLNVCIVLIPAPIEYYPYLDKKKVDTTIGAVRALSDKMSVPFLNYMTDPRFVREDFAVAAIEHLNATGAEKFSRLVSQDIFH